MMMLNYGLPPKLFASAFWLSSIINVLSNRSINHNILCSILPLLGEARAVPETVCSPPLLTE